MLNIKGAQISHETPGIGKNNSESFEIFSCESLSGWRGSGLLRIKDPPDRGKSAWVSS